MCWQEYLSKFFLVKEIANNLSLVDRKIVHNYNGFARRAMPQSGNETAKCRGIVATRENFEIY